MLSARFVQMGSRAMALSPTLPASIKEQLPLPQALTSMLQKEYFASSVERCPKESQVQRPDISMFGASLCLSRDYSHPIIKAAVISGLV